MHWIVRLSVLLVAIATASCNHAAAVPGEPTMPALALVLHDAIPQTVHVIPFYNFGKSGNDLGSAPGSMGGLIGTPSGLYGAADAGGSQTCTTIWDLPSQTGCGSVYLLSPGNGKRTYKLHVLHTFTGAPYDGAAALGSLVADTNGNLFGTTFFGGLYDGGTIFELHPTSSGAYSYSIVHNFGYGQDAAYPASGLIAVKGAYYGTSVGGGTYTSHVICQKYGESPNGTCGTIYRFDAQTGAVTVLHSFGASGDGADPYAAPTAIGDRLYGTTYLGGSQALCGTVYSIGTDGSGEKIVHNFLNWTFHDGCDPFSALTKVGGTLYGTTCCGGGYYSNTKQGTLYGVDIATGDERVLHNFGGYGSDGSEPIGPVAYVGGVLYGTTPIGGNTGCDSGLGCGTIFHYVPKSKSYSVAYAFKGDKDGAAPKGALLYSEGTFFGTTTVGGKAGAGTAVKFAP